MVLSPHGDPRDPNTDARAFFMMITLSPDWERFGGPCPRCKKFFIRKTAKPSIYCSHRCASQDSAIQRTNKVREGRREEKLAVATEAISKWQKLRDKGRTREGWKEWVAGYNPGAEITIRFLTRAVNQGALQPPAIQEKKRPRATKRRPPEDLDRAEG